MTTRGALGGLLVVLAAVVVAIVVVRADGDRDTRDDVRLDPAQDVPVDARGRGAVGPAEALDVFAPRPAEPIDPTPAAIDAPARVAAARAAFASDAGVHLTVTGRVVTRLTRPVGDLRVRLVPDDPTLRAAGLPTPRETVLQVGTLWEFPSLPLEALPSARTTSDGRFVIEVSLAAQSLDVRRALRQTLLVLDDGWATLAHEFESRGGEVDLGDLFVDGEVPVRGRLVDDDGRPLAGVRLQRHDDPDIEAFATHDFDESEFADCDPLTDADGRFAVRGAWPGGLWLAARLPGRVRWTTWLDLAAGEAVDLGDVVMTRGGAVEARVLDDASGEPLAGALVLVTGSPPTSAGHGDVVFLAPEGADTLLHEVSALRDDDGYDQALTDVQGRFRIAGLDGDAMAFYAVLAGYEPLRVDGVRPDVDAPTLRLRREAALVLDVVDADGRPLDGLSLRAFRCAVPQDPAQADAEDARRAQAYARRFDQPLEVLAGDAGRARDARFVPAPGRVLVPGVGRFGTRIVVGDARHVDEEFVLPGQDPATRVGERLVLSRAVVVEVSVRDHAGVSVRGATVELALPDGTRHSARTDGQGACVLAVRPAHGVTLRVGARGHAPVERGLDLAPGPARVEDIVLPESASVVAHAREVDGTPAKVTLDLARVADDGTRGALQRRSSRDDRVTWTDLAPGTYRVLAPWSEGEPFGLAAGEQREIDVVRPPPTVVHGRVTSGGRPVVEPVVHVHELPPPSGSPWPGVLHETQRSSEVRVVGDAYAVTLRSPGNWAVVVGEGATVRTEPLVVAWAPGRDVPHDVALPSGEVRGVVVDAAGRPAPGGEVLLCDAEREVRARSEVDARGRFAFAHVPPGRYACFLPSCGDPARRESPLVDVDVGVGAVDVRLTTAPGARLSGRLVDVDPATSTRVGFVRVDAGRPAPRVSQRASRRALPGRPSREILVTETLDALRVVPSSAGVYSVSALEPGEWRVAVAPESADDVLRRGERVVLRDGDDVVLDLHGN